MRGHIESSLRDANAALTALLANDEALGNIERAAAILVEVLCRKAQAPRVIRSGDKNWVDPRWGVLIQHRGGGRSALSGYAD